MPVHDVRFPTPPIMCDRFAISSNSDEGKRIVQWYCIDATIASAPSSLVSCRENLAHTRLKILYYR
jgi:hypothetical protein